MSDELARVREEAMAEVAPAKAMLQDLEALIIDDSESYDMATEGLKIVKAEWQRLEDRRTSVTGPMNKALAEVNGWFKPAQTPWKQAEAMLKAKIGAYVQAQRQAQVQAIAQTSAAVERQDYQAATQALASIPAVPQAQGITVREIWDYEILDESLIPRKYLTVDHDKIRARARMADTERTPPLPIEGLRWFPNTRVAARK